MYNNECVKVSIELREAKESLKENLKAFVKLYFKCKKINRTKQKFKQWTKKEKCLEFNIISTIP